MTDFTPKQIRNNCADGDHCDCAANIEHGIETAYWECPSWGRSTLAVPKILKHGRSTFITEFRDDGQRRIKRSLKVAKERGLPVPDQFKDANKYLKRKLDL